MPPSVGELLGAYPFLLTAGWGTLGIWVGIGLAVTVFGVSTTAVVLGLLFAAVVAFAGRKATQRAITHPDTPDT